MQPAHRLAGRITHHVSQLNSTILKGRQELAAVTVLDDAQDLVDLSMRIPASSGEYVVYVGDLTLVRDEFSDLLEKTELGHIISASSLIAERIVALKVLREIVFEPKHRRTIKERGELDVLIRDNTWIFGEGFHFTMAEAGLTKIMDRVSAAEGP